MVEKLFHLNAPSPADSVLDPGSGRGAFIDGIVRYCSRTGLQLPRIVAVESDPDHVAVLRDKYASVASVVVKEADFLREYAPEQFDYIVGNPPYVSISGLDEREKTAYRALFKTAVGRFDLYILFFEKALSGLKRGGRLVFITPEKYTYVKTAAPLRELMSTMQISELHYFDEETFPNLVTYPLVTVIDAIEPDSHTRVAERHGTVHYTERRLASSSWLPVLKRAAAPSGAPTLKAISRRISCGVATGADSVFTVDRSTIPADLVPFGYPTLSGRELVSSELPEWRRFMLVPYQSDGALLPETELGPLALYLNEPTRKERLLRRTCVQSKPWYAFHENPPLREVLRPKLLCKDIGSRPVFVIDRSGEILPRHSLYYIVPRNPSVLDELAEFLNSDHVARWLGDHCQRAANGFLRLQSHVLKELPLPESLNMRPVQLSLSGTGGDKLYA